MTESCAKLEFRPDINCPGLERATEANPLIVYIGLIIPLYWPEKKMIAC